MDQANILLSLPQELLLTICCKLDLNNLKNLRLSCKVLAERLSFLVLSHIGIRANSIEDIVSALRLLTNAANAVVNYTTEITINNHKKHDTRMVDGVAHEDVDVQKISEEFSTALTSLKAVRTVRWYTRMNDPLWSQESIWNAIRCLPALRTLFIDASSLRVNLENLDALIALESITIAIEKFYEHQVALFHSVSSLYASSANLISIELDAPNSEGYDLHQLLTRKPKADTTGRLRHLALCNFPVRTYQDTLTHLKSLTSLNLSLPLYVALSDSPDKFWNAFRLSKIHLEELELGYFAMGFALNDYLSSFSGLKRLKLCVKEEKFADEFWTNTLPNHVDTLQDFSLRSWIVGSRWCFGNHNRSVIAKCTKLKRFTITVPPDRLNPEIMSTLIEIVLTHMPHIERLGLDINGRMCSHSRKQCYEPALTDLVSKYQPPAHLQDCFANVHIFCSHSDKYSSCTYMASHTWTGVMAQSWTV